MDSEREDYDEPDLVMSEDGLRALVADALYFLAVVVFLASVGVQCGWISF
jgi:hypothetical protein